MTNSLPRSQSFWFLPVPIATVDKKGLKFLKDLWCCVGGRVETNVSIIEPIIGLITKYFCAVNDCGKSRS